MRSPEAFDAFYAATRDRLLLETYALTGDLPASRTAVRDAFVVAAHHWSKVSRLEDPEAWVRPLAHGRAQRRHNARIWHRDKSLDAETAATLEALAKLPSTQRKTLVLTMLSPLPLSEIARLVGLPRSEAERALQTATSQFAIHRKVGTTDVRGLLQGLRTHVGTSRWPRSTILRRSGAARRRTHTVIGAGVAVAALLVSGGVVASGGAQPTSLRTEKVTAGVSVRPAAAPETPTLDAEGLLSPDQVGRFGKSLTWSETGTSDNLEGDGIVLPCQPERFADPKGLGALMRSFEGTDRVVKVKEVRRNGELRKQRKRVDQVQTVATEFVELSSSDDVARRTFATAQLWYAGCLDERTQLMSTQRVSGVGDEATVFSFRSWARQPARLAVGVARTGQLTVTTVVRSTRDATDTRALASAMAASVNGLCGSPGAGRCAGPPRTRAVDPFAIGRPAGLLSAVDLPPVTNAVGPWVGTDPEPARTNFAATRCDNTRFQGKGISHSLTRTFVFPQRKKIDEFGLTQSAATLSERGARDFVAEVRRRIRTCGQANLGTTVNAIVQRSTKHQELTAWDLEIEVSDSRSVEFLMAIVRDGNAVSQVGFTPVSGLNMSRTDFLAVADRALARLSNLPGAKR
jgi:DNA-directed RNA polymerase specialized sigma24 family protein